VTGSLYIYKGKVKQSKAKVPDGGSTGSYAYDANDNMPPTGTASSFQIKKWYRW